MKNELFSIGPFTVHGYGLMIGIGILAAYWLSEYRAKKHGLDENPIFAMAIFCVLGGFIGSKFLYALTILPKMIEDPSVIKDLATGWVVYGGIIGGIVTAIVFCKIKKMEFLKYFDIIIPSVALAQGFGRIGCFLAGCCYGLPTDSFWGITFTHSHYAPNGVELVPTQLISSGLNFIHFFILILLSKKLKTPGQIGGCYLVFYSVGRFILEFFRGDLIRGSVGILTTSQFISIFTFAAGIAIIVITEILQKKRKAGVQENE